MSRAQDQARAGVDIMTSAEPEAVVLCVENSCGEYPSRAQDRAQYAVDIVEIAGGFARLGIRGTDAARRTTCNFTFTLAAAWNRTPPSAQESIAILSWLRLKWIGARRLPPSMPTSPFWPASAAP